MMKLLGIFFLLYCLSLQGVEKLTIIGTGAAGCTAAIFGGQAELSPFVVKGRECEGSLGSVAHIENYPGFPEGISGDALIERMQLQAEKFGARFSNCHVVDVNLRVYPYQITLNNGDKIESLSLIIATGSTTRWLEIPGEEELKECGVSNSALCDAHLFQGKKVVVAGGGDAALEQALHLASFAEEIYLVHRGDRLNAAPYLIEKMKGEPKIDCILQSQIQQILGKDWVEGVVYQNLASKEEKTLSCDGIFVAIGRKPNTDLFLGQVDMDEGGFITTQGSATSVTGVFAAGDIIKNAQRKIITAAASGCHSALEATQFLQN